MHVRPVRFSFVFLLAAVMAAGVLVAIEPRSVSACSLRYIEPADRLARFSEWSEAIVVGEVVDEVRVPHPGTWPRYESRIEVVATLAGEVPEEIVLRDLGQLGADCSGGPRLVEGERVLLFLVDRDALGMAVDEWRVADSGQAKYRLDAGQALYHSSYTGEDQPEQVGAAAELIEEIASMNNSDPGQVTRALEFAQERQPELSLAEPPMAGDEETTAIPMVALGVGLAVAIVTIVLTGVVLRRRAGRV